MLALLAIAFGKDMATATVMSLEPFLAEKAPSPLFRFSKPPPAPPLPGGRKRSVSKSSAETGPGTGSGGVGRTAKVCHAEGVLVHGKSSATGAQKGSGGALGEEGGGADGEAGRCYDWLLGGVGAGEGLPWKRRRYSSVVVPVGSSALDTEATERQVTVKTAARLGCAVGNLTARQRKMLIAKVSKKNTLVLEHTHCV